MSSLVIPSPFTAHGLCYIASGYVGDSHRPTFAIKPGASGDFTPDGDYTDSPFIEWYQGTSSPYNTSQIVYRDYSIHALRSRLLNLSRCEDGQASLRKATILSSRFLHVLALGIQRKTILFKRRRFDLRRQGGDRIRNPCDQSTGRIVLGHAGNRTREIARTHQVKTVLHHGNE